MLRWVWPVAGGLLVWGPGTAGAASISPPLTKATVISGPKEPSIVVIDGRRLDFGYTGRGAFCLNGASTAKLGERSDQDLFRLENHYRFCLEDGASQALVRAERDRRKKAAR